MRKKLIISIILTASIFSLIKTINIHASEITSTQTPVATTTVNIATSTLDSTNNNQEAIYNDFSYKIDENNNITITKYEGTEINVIIPDEINDKEVTSIKSDAFDNTSIENLTIGKNIYYFNNSFLSNCNNLKEINVNSENEEYISINGILYTKDKHNLVKYPNNKQTTNFIIPDYVYSIWPFAFSNCSNLISITIPSNVKDISKYAFYKCNGLKEVNLLTDLDKVKGDSKFYYCENIEKINTSYFLAWFASRSEIDSIRKNTFKGSNNLTTLNDDNGNTITELDPIKDTEVTISTDTLSDIDKYSNCSGYSTRTADKHNLLIIFLCTLVSLPFIKCHKKNNNI